ncbi:MAG: hypothetical protein PHZ10_07720 [Aliarcobacter cryaerophilus]|nr:hypothetical protein [Aliarcobacter cryaerophilus]
MLALIAFCIVALKVFVVSLTDQIQSHNNGGAILKNKSQKSKIFLVSVFEVLVAIGAGIVSGGLLA